MMLLEVALQQVSAEVVLGVAPEGVDVVGIPLRGRVLDGEVGTHDAPVVGLVNAEVAHPEKAGLLQSRLHAFSLGLGQVDAQPVGPLAEDPEEVITLGEGQIRTVDG